MIGKTLRVIRRLAALLVVALLGLGLWLFAFPPEKLRVGDGYAAKIVCSNVFLAKRDAEEVLRLDVQAPGHPLLRLVRVDVDRERATVTARFLGFLAPVEAVYRPGYGCAVAPGDDPAAARAEVSAIPALAKESTTVPQGEMADAISVDPGLQAILSDEALAGPQMRAIVVVKDGKIVGETYGDGFDRDTPLLGWSMAKTVNAAIIGRLMEEGRMHFSDSGLLPEWKGDERAEITLAELMAMESGLEFNENYGDVSDVTRMIYLEPDMAGFAARKPLEKTPGAGFRYSTGNSVLLSRIWMNRFADPSEALAYPRQALFDPLGMESAVLEVDAHGTFVGGSYLYATARDWARFGQLLLQDGIWNGTRLLPEEFMAAMRTPSAHSDGRYTQAQAWLTGPDGSRSEANGLPADVFWAQGHDGQTMAIVPSQNLVVVRLGLTPRKLGYRPQELLKAVIDRLD